MLRRPITACALAAALAAAAPASAVGPPPSAAQGGPGIVDPSTQVRFVASARGASTLVRALRLSDRTLLGEQLVPGRLGVPVASSIHVVRTGLSADGRTLVLGQVLPQDPQAAPATTRIALLATGLRRPARVFTLHGVFTVDAVSPGGRYVYLIERRDGSFLDYAVRAFDARAGRLLPGAIVDRREPGPMHGYPVDRASADGGRLAFTLYAGLGSESFVHALDTVHRTARCLDLPRSVADADIWSLRLRAHADGRVLVVLHGRPVAAIDTRSLTLSGTAEAA